LDLSRVEGGYALRLVKAEGRALGAEAEAPHRYQDVRGKLNLVADSRRELLRLGKLIRAARLQRGMSQAELGDLLGVTASTVSQAENGLIALSLPNLFAVARKLELNLATVLDGREMPKDAVAIMRQKDRPRSRVAGSKRKPVYVERLRDLDLVGDVEPLMVIVAPGAKLNKHFSLRKGTEFGLLLTGHLHVEIAGRTRELQPGDSIYLENDVPSAWSNPAAEEAQLLWVVALR
jgi:transcriptional regulator with XRE-family HTH domain